MAHRGITYRLILGTKARAQQLACLAGATRYVWNYMLDLQEETYLACRAAGCTKTPSPTFFTLGKEFTHLRKRTPWLQELSFQIVRYALKYQADAWGVYFKGQRGRAKFKAKRGDDSFTIPVQVKLRKDHIYIPKIGWMVIRGSTPYPDGKPINATVHQSCGKWYCSVTYEVDLPEQEENGLAIGIDRNVGQIATSTGEILPLPDTKRLEAKVKRYSRMVNRRQKGSNRRKRANQLYARSHRRLANTRKNWCHQTSRILADSASEIVLEDLNTSGMTRSAKGTVEEPGKNVKQKSGLNREILKSGWNQLENMLDYKAHTLTKVPAKHTSQMCSECGNIDKKNRVSQAQFQCTACGHSGNADINAALNILVSGIGTSGRRGAFTLVTPMNRQNVRGVRLAYLS